MKVLLFEDEERNQLRFRINKTGLLYIGAGDPDDVYYNGYICLDKEDVKLFIEELQRLYSDM
jgi:hypothetical protein